MPNQKILIVDDEPAIVELCTRYLTGDGYSVQSASNGFAALEFLKQKPFDLLLTDIWMSGMSGLDLIDAAKKETPGITIVVITGHGTVNMAIESLKLGTLGFIIKPFTRDEMITAIRQAMEKTQLARENIRLNSLMPLFEINRRLNTTDLAVLFKQIVDSACKETNAERGSLMLLDDARQVLHLKAHYGFSEVIAAKQTKTLGQGIAGMVAETRKPLIIQGGVEQNPELADRLDDADVISSISVPLIGKERSRVYSLTRLPAAREHLIGVLNISKSDPQAAPFSESDLEFVAIMAGQVSAAIESATLYRDLHQSYVKTIRSLVATIEVKDAYTSGHSENVSRYSMALAEEMRLSANEIDEIAIGGILHDIGKIGSAADILLKEASLSKEEFEHMKLHPESAVKILKPVGLSESILNIILHHHERCNGKGYPSGLNQDQIPIGARIIMVADTIDAMTSDRPYRKALPFAKLVAELKKYSGPQFDPDVVTAFERLLKRVGPDFFRHRLPQINA